MSAEGNGQPIRYKLDMSGLVSKQIDELIQQAFVEGIGPKVIAALQKIFKRLQDDPLNFGELVQHFKHLNLLGHAAVVHPLVVHFAVHPEKKFVVIQKVFKLT